MKIVGKYKDDSCRSLHIQKNSMIALEISSAWTEGYSDKEDEKKFYVVVRSGCYMFHIKSNNGEYYSKIIADELINKLALNEIVILEDENKALYDAIDTTPDEYLVRNAYDE